MTNLDSTGKQNASSSDAAERSSVDELALKVSLSLYEDARGLGSHQLASGLIYMGAEPTEPQDIQRVQETRAFNRLERYPDEPYFNQTFYLDQQTSQKIADNPMTKAAMPFATIGYLTDRFDRITNNKSISLDDLEQFSKSRTDAGPLEQSILNYAREHFVDLWSLGNGGMTRSDLRQIGYGLNDLRATSVADPGMTYLENNFPKIDQQIKGAGVTVADIKGKVASTAAPDERAALENIVKHHPMMTAFDTADGVLRNGGTPKMPVRHFDNSIGITARDIQSWRAGNEQRQRLGVESRLDDSLKNYYDSARRQIQATKVPHSETMFDEIMK